MDSILPKENPWQLYPGTEYDFLKELTRGRAGRQRKEKSEGLVVGVGCLKGGFSKDRERRDRRMQNNIPQTS